MQGSLWMRAWAYFDGAGKKGRKTQDMEPAGLTRALGRGHSLGWSQGGALGGVAVHELQGLHGGPSPPGPSCCSSLSCYSCC